MIKLLNFKVMFDYIEMEVYAPDGYNQEHIVSNGVLSGGKKPMSIKYNEHSKILKVKGSLPYFMQGHNFWFNKKDTEEAIVKLSNLLGVDLFSAEIKILEYGMVLFRNFTMDDFIQTHLKTTGYKRSIWDEESLYYTKTEKTHRLKFYDIWTNIDNSKNKILGKTREMLEKSDYCRKNKPMRYEIHGNPKHFVGESPLFVSDLFEEDFEIKCQDFMLNEYRKIKKWERLRISGIKKYNAIWLIMTLFAEIKPDYQEIILNTIDRMNIKIHSKNKAKSYFRAKFKEIPHEKCSYSIEDLILKAFEERNSSCQK